MHVMEHGETCTLEKFSVPKVFENSENSEISKKAVLTSELLEKIRNSFKFGTRQEFIDLLVKEGVKPAFASRIFHLLVDEGKLGIDPEGYWRWI